MASFCCLVVDCVVVGFSAQKVKTGAAQIFLEEASGRKDPAEEQLRLCLRLVGDCGRGSEARSTMYRASAAA